MRTEDNFLQHFRFTPVNVKAGVTIVNCAYNLSTGTPKSYSLYLNKATIEWRIEWTSVYSEAEIVSGVRFVYRRVYKFHWFDVLDRI
jgi:hypothetical protein